MSDTIEDLDAAAIEWERTHSERLRIGHYKMKDEKNPVRYVYISKAYMSKPKFLDDLFIALGIPYALGDKVKALPNLIFDVESTEDLEDWNLRLPLSKLDLVGETKCECKDHVYDHKNAKDTDGDGGIEKSEMKVLEYYQPLRQHQSLVETSCRRILKGLASGALQVGACMQVDATFDPTDGRDQITEWIESSDIPVPVFGLAGKGDYTDEIYDKIIQTSEIYDPQRHAPDLDGFPYFEIDPTNYYNHKIKPPIDEDGDVSNTIPHNNMTHLIVTNDVYRLTQELNKSVKYGYMLVHGSVTATKYAIEAIQEGRPCFIFKNTGSTADLLCETLTSVDKMLRLRRLNPNEHVDPPFSTEMRPDRYMHPNWLWPFEADDIESCRLFNLFMENFPDGFNPSSILQIDIFNVTEKRLLEQIEKTVVQVFEGSSNNPNQFTSSTNNTDIAILKGNRAIVNVMETSKVNGGGANATSGNTGDPAGDDLLEDMKDSKRDGKRLKVGYYKMKDEANMVRYVFVSDKYMNKPNFLDDVFNALGIADAYGGTFNATPNLVFNIESTNDFEDWNVRLPPFKIDLIGKDHVYDYETTNNDGNIVTEKSEMRIIEHCPPLRHYQSVIESNCRRLLKGTASACMQAGAIFQVDPSFDHFDGRDQITEWIAASGVPVPILGVAGKGAFTRKIYDQLKQYGEEYDPDDSDEDEEDITCIEIDPTKWYNGELKPRVVGEMGEIQDSIPHNNLTHLIVTNDIYRLNKELKKAIPTGLLVLHGGVSATKHFCDAIQNGEPVFIFKYTGSTADLACETLDIMEKVVAQRRQNRFIRPRQPFGHNLKSDIYMHPYWLWPFDKDHVEICRLLNILVENFPDRYDPASVLQIDMFDTSEEKLQDQLTKTMSVVFEGVAELGGQAAEDRRLTYAWRLRHLLEYNSKKQKLRADFLRSLIIIFTLLAVCASVLYSYGTINYYSYVGNPTAINALLRLNLIIPLIVTVLRGIYAALNPAVKASILQIAAVKVESEIYMYRTKVGLYSVRKANAASANAVTKRKRKDAGGGKDRKDKDDQPIKANNPRKAFSNALDMIWTDLSASDINKGGLINPPRTADPLQEINDRIEKHTLAQDYYLSSIAPSRKVKGKESHGQKVVRNSMENLMHSPLAERKMNQNATNTNNGNTSYMNPANGRPSLAQEIVSRPPATGGSVGGPLGRFTHTIRNQATTTTTTTKDLEMQQSSHRFSHMPSIGTMNDRHRNGTVNVYQNPLLSGTNNMNDIPSRPASMYSLYNTKYNERSDTNPTTPISSSNLSMAKSLGAEPLYDDGLSTLSADEYVRIRLIPMVSEFTTDAPVYSRSITIVTAIVILLSIASSIFSSFDLTTFIPLALAFGESLTAWQSHNTTEMKLMQTNGAMNQLNKLIIWWDSLSMIEKRVASNKEQLVLITESAVQGQIAIYHSNNNQTARDDDDDE